MIEDWPLRRKADFNPAASMDGGSGKMSENGSARRAKLTAAYNAVESARRCGSRPLSAQWRSLVLKRPYRRSLREVVLCDVHGQLHNSSRMTLIVGFQNSASFLTLCLKKSLVAPQETHPGFKVK